MQIAIIVLLLAAIALIVAAAVLTLKGSKKLSREITELADRKPDTQETDKALTEIKLMLEGMERQNFTSDKLLREELANSIAASRRSQTETMETGFAGVRNVLNEKLGEIKGTVDEKMTKTLNERLDSNFKQIGERLGELYKTLGELNRLSGGVQDLNKTLSNVKTRGIWGERQLAAILEDTMAPSQYDQNVATKRGSSDRVEFAVKLPSGNQGERKFTYLPIDSKMPADIYNRIYSAAEACDSAAVAAAVKELEQRIKAEAKSISSKYIDTPYTTDFAIMFLPTEGLYAEVLRIDGLSEWCQTSERIMIAGPTTITALLNSLRVGFANVALNEKSAQVLELLMAVKAQYKKFGEQIDTVQSRLNSALKSAEELKHRSDIIQKKMGAVGELDSKDAEKVLGWIEEKSVDSDD